ncbi:MAG: HNH endonuclease [Longimicrobiales bacterium]
MSGEYVSVGTYPEYVSGGTPEHHVSAGTSEGHVSGGTSADHVSAGTSEDRAPSSTPLSFQVPPASGITPFPPETARRIACDADLVEMTHDSGGGVLDVGRKRRTIPPAIRRALDHRDGGCRFPGCNCRYVDAHHIVHWSDGGETKLENLVLLCRRHHRAVHEEGFRVEAREAPEGVRMHFYRPDGELVPVVPQSPAVPADAMADLVRRNRFRGVDPDAWTATPLWQGEVLDLSLAIDMLRGLEGGARGRAGGKGPGSPTARDSRPGMFPDQGCFPTRDDP